MYSVNDNDVNMRLKEYLCDYSEVIMSRRAFKFLLLAEGVLCVILAWFDFFGHLKLFNMITFPFVQLSTLLKYLIGMGGFWHGIAISLFIVIGLIPLLILRQKVRNHSYNHEDLLLVLISILIMLVEYYMIHDHYITGLFSLRGLESNGELLLCAVLNITIFTYVLLWLLRKFHVADADKLLVYIKRFLYLDLIVMVFYLCGFTIGTLLNEIRDISINRCAFGIDYTMTDSFIVLSSITRIIPEIFILAVLWNCLGLIIGIEKHKGFSVIEKLLIRIEKRCRNGIIVSLLIVLSLSILKLFYANRLVCIGLIIRIPIVQLIVLMVILLIVRYLRIDDKLRFIWK